jgi:chromosome segregation ATPase
MVKVMPVVASLWLAACGGNSLPPASSPATAAPGGEPQPTGASAPKETTLREDLKGELASLDASLSDLNKRLGSARDSVKAEVQERLAALEKRDDELKAQLKEAGARADVEAEKARRQIHEAVVDMKSDVKRLADRLGH